MLMYVVFEVVGCRVRGLALHGQSTAVLVIIQYQSLGVARVRGKVSWLNAKLLTWQYLMS